MENSDFSGFVFCIGIIFIFFILIDLYTSCVPDHMENYENDYENYEY